MMQDYEFTHTDTSPSCAGTTMQAPWQILQNIISFARCCQSVDAAGFKIRLFLN